MNQNPPEAQWEGASHAPFEAHPRNASHRINETPDHVAGHTLSETQVRSASHLYNEAQKPIASQPTAETQWRSASHGISESQTNLASQRIYINQTGSTSEEELRRYVELKRLVDIFYDVQDVRIRTANRERTIPGHTEGLYSDRLKRVERELLRNISMQLKDVPIWRGWLSTVKGIGPTLGAGWIANVMIAYRPVKSLEACSEIQRAFHLKTKDKKILLPTIRGIGAFPNLSKFWKWLGLDVEEGHAPRRAQGKKYGRNPKMAVLCWKTRKQFIMVGNETYRPLYEMWKRKLMIEGPYAKALKDPKKCPRYEECRDKLIKAAKRLGREPKKFPCLKHIDLMAARAMVKLGFVKDLYFTWRRLEGLPETETYEEAVLKRHRPRENQGVIASQSPSETQS